MTEFAFDLGSGGAVVGDPGGVGLAGPGGGEGLLVRADVDRAPTGGGGALRAQRTRLASRPEIGHAAAGAGRTDRGGDPARAADRAEVEAGIGVSVEVDVEPVLAEPATRRGGRLGLAARLDPGLAQPIVELAGAVGVVAVDRRPLAAVRAAVLARLGGFGPGGLGP